MTKYRWHCSLLCVCVLVLQGAFRSQLTASEGQQKKSLEKKFFRWDLSCFTDEKMFEGLRDNYGCWALNGNSELLIHGISSRRGMHALLKLGFEANDASPLYIAGPTGKRADPIQLTRVGKEKDGVYTYGVEATFMFTLMNFSSKKENAVTLEFATLGGSSRIVKLDITGLFDLVEYLQWNQ